MEADLIAFLLGTPGISSLVEQRVHWNARPQASELPSITLQRISDVPVNTDDGADALKETRVQVDVWAVSFTSALEVARAIETALSGRSFTHGSTEFQGVYIDNSADTTEPGSARSTVIHRTRVDYLIWHKEN